MGDSRCVPGVSEARLELKVSFSSPHYRKLRGESLCSELGRQKKNTLFYHFLELIKDSCVCITFLMTQVDAFFGFSFHPLLKKNNKNPGCSYFQNVQLTFWTPPSTLFNDYSSPPHSFLQYNKLPITTGTNFTVCRRYISMGLEDNRTLSFHTVTRWCDFSCGRLQGMVLAAWFLSSPQTLWSRSLSSKTDRREQCGYIICFLILSSLIPLLILMGLMLRGNAILDLAEWGTNKVYTPTVSLTGQKS